MDSYPPIKPVRVRHAGASHEGPTRSYNEDAWGFFEDKTSAIAIVADGMGGHYSGRRGADMAVESCKELFEGRSTTILDDLAEIWWKGEHAHEIASSASSVAEAASKDASANANAVRRIRPYSTLPVADRVELRDHVKQLLSKRVAESLGDVAVLEGEVSSLFQLPNRIIQRGNLDIHRRSEKDPTFRGTGSTAVCAIFAAGHAALGSVGDSRISRFRPGTSTLEALTVEHTLINEYISLNMDLTEEQLAELPRNVITRALGMTDTVKCDQRTVPLEKGDFFVLMCDGLFQTFNDEEIVREIRRHGVNAANVLVDRGKVELPNHSHDNLTMIVVEILDAGVP